MELFRKLPGMKDFDPGREVPSFLKSICGLKDAPRLFGMRLSVTLDTCGLNKSQSDHRIRFKHKAGRRGVKAVALVVSSHIDDLKGAGEKEGERSTAGSHKDIMEMTQR